MFHPRRVRGPPGAAASGAGAGSAAGSGSASGSAAAAASGSAGASAGAGASSGQPRGPNASLAHQLASSLGINSLLHNFLTHPSFTNADAVEAAAAAAAAAQPAAAAAAPPPPAVLPLNLMQLGVMMGAFPLGQAPQAPSGVGVGVAAQMGTGSIFAGGVGGGVGVGGGAHHHHPPAPTHPHVPHPHVHHGVAHSVYSSSTSSGGSTASSAASTTLTVLQGGHTGAVRALALNADASVLASGDEQGIICLWSARENRLLKRKLITLSDLEPFDSHSILDASAAASQSSAALAAAGGNAHTHTSHNNGAGAGGHFANCLQADTQPQPAAAASSETGADMSASATAALSNEAAQFTSLASTVPRRPVHQPTRPPSAPTASLMADVLDVSAPFVSSLSSADDLMSTGASSSGALSAPTPSPSARASGTSSASPSKWTPLPIRHLYFAQQAGNAHVLYVAAGVYVLECDTRQWRAIGQNGQHQSQASRQQTQQVSDRGEQQNDEVRRASPELLSQLALPTSGISRSPTPTGFVSASATAISTSTPAAANSSVLSATSPLSLQRVRAGASAPSSPFPSPSPSQAPGTSSSTLSSGVGGLGRASTKRAAATATTPPAVSSSAAPSVCGRVLLQHEAPVLRVTLNPAETMLASADDGGTIKVLHLCASAATPASTPDEPRARTKRQRVLLSVKKHAGRCAALAFRRPSNAVLVDYLQSALEPLVREAGLEPPQPLSRAALLSSASAAAFAGAAAGSGGFAFRASDAAGLPTTPASIGGPQRPFDPAFLSAVERAQLYMQWQLISGGVDCKVQVMEFEHRGRSLNIFDMTEILDDNQLPPSQQVAVTDVAASDDGALVACALDNGLVVLLDATQKNLVTLVPFTAHQAPITRLALFCTTPPPAAVAAGQPQPQQTTRQYVLLSASHDASLVAHELRIAARPDRLVVTLRNINTVDHWQRVLWFEARSLDRVYVADGSPNITLCSLA